MSAENEAKQSDPQEQAPQQQPGHRSSQVQRDEEIEAIQQHSKHQHAGIQRPPERPPAAGGKALLIVGIALLVLLLAGGLTLLARWSQSRALAKETEQSAVPSVAVVHPQAEKPDVELVLPGSLLAYKESPIYARTNGYLVRWLKDIGSRVKKGELLAQIDTPEVDQELNQGRAARQQILAQMELAKISSERWESLRKSDSVSAQEADQQTSGYQQSKANLVAADANVRRLEELESFKNVYAPFSGVLTRRNVDPGALINSGAGGRELFDMAQVDTLRVYTSVPQAYAPFIKAGGRATVTLQEFPGEKFAGVVARTAEAIDPATRTLLTEVDVVNQDGRLLPGSFGQVHFAVGANVQKLTVPVNTMLFRAEGPRVAVVGPDHRVELRPLNIGRDYGTSLEVLGGLAVSDQIIVNPPDSLENGQQVNIAQPSSGQPAQDPPPAEKQKGSAS
jgi:RND family efflux transporter MFP subunit